ncbi:MAG TPA: bacteriohopanetetrol glucosamine biosynthesis glycosyltransferase HpnI [Candidatus Sulfotelmatobacter sp.]|nr:bacteriohopanetetrol glucosamine biosynthesis glycosyltransferase HpnI [Candidatus Sulfotelmatobacter sp.]
MMHSTAAVLQVIAIFGCISSCAYYVLCLLGARHFIGSLRNSSGALSIEMPPVSVLKPLKGTDPEMYRSFRSHCLQDYPEYEIVFGVSDAADPAGASIERLKKEFPERLIQLVICPEILGPNVKVSNLEQMAHIARYEYLVVNDSDIRVERDYLRRIVRPLADDKIGMVTCLYRGVAASTLGSRLEALGISTDFCAGVIAARLLEGGLSFGLGSTLAFRRRELNRIGGFKSIVDFLADDYELGNRIAGLGQKVQLSDVVVETYLPAYDFGGFLAHQMRWARGVRDARMGGYVGLASTFGLMWALLNLLFAGAATWAWIVLGCVLLLRILVALVVGKSILNDRQVPRLLWLLPVRDLLAVAIWIVSFWGHTVKWRGDLFELRKGRLVRIS